MSDVCLGTESRPAGVALGRGEEGERVAKGAQLEAAPGTLPSVPGGESPAGLGLCEDTGSILENVLRASSAGGEGGSQARKAEASTRGRSPHRGSKERGCRDIGRRT